MGAAQSATQTIGQNILKEEYQNKEACKVAATANAASVAADALNAEGIQSMTSSVSGIALMRCVGKSYIFIILYHLVLICIIVACALFIPPAIPDRVWQNCTICTRHTGGRRNRRCIESRRGTPQECKRAGIVAELVISTIVGCIIAGIINGIYTFYLKTKVYKLGALTALTVVGTVV